MLNASATKSEKEGKAKNDWLVTRSVSIAKRQCQHEQPCQGRLQHGGCNQSTNESLAAIWYIKPAKMDA